MARKPYKERPSGPRAALVGMPFFLADRPSIQLGLLLGEARAAGFHADSFHLNLELAARLTPAVYELICTSPRALSLGEWLFSIAAFGDQVEKDDAAYFRAFPEAGAWAKEKLGKDASYLTSLRHEVMPAFIADCLGLAEWGGYDVVGFSSTFQQNAASLALARRIKEKFPRVSIVFGGANLEGEMGPELARAFPFIDYVVVGEADLAFPALLGALSGHGDIADIPGLVWRDHGKIMASGQAPPVMDLASLPPPDYDEFFERAARLGISLAWTVPFESSRGCWWGKKSHCTFCGLNGIDMAYRVRPAGRVLSELNLLARKHRVTWFQATDNVLNMDYLPDLFARVKEQRLDYQFFYELKAILSRGQVRELYEGGVRWVEPGIESLSSRVLKLMRKGTTMLGNVNMLRWLRYHRIRASWSLLWGFAGETAADYDGQLSVARLITHLQPPVWWGRIWLERFSPYFIERDKFPVHDVRPLASYAHVYPAGVDLARAAYFFDYKMDNAVADEELAGLKQFLAAWQKTWNDGRPDSLTFRRTEDAIFIDDARLGKQETSAFYGPMAAIYAFCSDSPRSLRDLELHLQASPATAAFTKTATTLQYFIAAGLMLSEHNQFLSLALPVNPNW
ncbi:MAG TPA: RiPP maturation radical SAM C-methyltransferase [bacterium]|nr:RiPP maturation radical SAM C-methyltransferase [bacterium]